MTTIAPLEGSAAQMRSRPSLGMPPVETDQRMRRNNSALLVGVLLLGVALLPACNGAEGGDTTTTTASQPTTTATSAPPAIEDGDWFAFVIVGEDETEEMTLGVDLAEMLSGEEARQAAVEDGFISEGEDLPNDFYIRNPETAYELLHMASTGEVLLISSTEPGQTIAVSSGELQQVYEGTHANQDGFYVAASQPIPMTVTVSAGEITALSQVYLP